MGGFRRSLENMETKDVKLLWGKAAHRCSMPFCRRPLSPESPEGDENIILGEMAHIVGEKKTCKSPRGLSKLPLEDRNRYSNMILLCATHHTLIDKDVKSWSVAKLHKTKREHELWVEERLGENSGAHEVYMHLVEIITVSLDLENWRWQCDHLFRHIMDTEFPEGVYQVDFEFFRANLPGEIPELEVELENLVRRTRLFLDYYMSDAEERPDDPRIMNRKRYNLVPFNQMSKRLELEDEVKDWEIKTHKLLYNLVKALNDFASCVREFLDPSYFSKRGKFCVYDEMGLAGSVGETSMTIPERYFSEDELDLDSSKFYKS